MFPGRTVEELIAPYRPLESGSSTEEIADTDSVTDPTGLVATSELPVWFGTRLAHLITLVDNWNGLTGEVDALQDLLNQEIMMFDMVAQGGDQDAILALSRRQALAALATLPLSLKVPGAISNDRSPSADGIVDLFLSRCATSITACWHLLRGRDLSTVDQTLSAYLLALEGLAQRDSAYKQAAARLASQAYRIRGIVALHRDQLEVREYHCKRALYYATVANDASSQASAMISLASTYFYDSKPAKAAAIYEHALDLEAEMPLLQRSRARAELAVVYGQLKREQDAIEAVELAGELYPDYPEQDRSFLYAEFTPASLALEQGLTYLALAEQQFGRYYKTRASDVFARVGKMPSTQVPDRIRFEIANHQARTAVLLDDVDAFESHIENAAGGVALLESRQRQRELNAAWQRGLAAWPREGRVKAIGARLRIGAGDRSRELR
jgi:tetratricopeptide (TPR) repeat protein